MLLSVSLSFNIFLLVDYIVHKPVFDSIVVVKKADSGVIVDKVIESHFGHKDVIAIAKLDGKKLMVQDGYDVLFVKDTSEKG